MSSHICELSIAIADQGFFCCDLFFYRITADPIDRTADTMECNDRRRGRHNTGRKCYVDTCQNLREADDCVVCVVHSVILIAQVTAIMLVCSSRGMVIGDVKTIMLLVA